MDVIAIALCCLVGSSVVIYMFHKAAQLGTAAAEKDLLKERELRRKEKYMNAQEAYKKTIAAKDKLYDDMTVELAVLFSCIEQATKDRKFFTTYGRKLTEEHQNYLKSIGYRIKYFVNYHNDIYYEISWAHIGYKPVDEFLQK